MLADSAADIEFEITPAIDAQLQELPNKPAVFLLHAREGNPFLSKTNLLRRRLLRLLRRRAQPSRLLSLRDTVRRVEIWYTGSGLESSLRHYVLARRIHPDTYREVLRLRPPSYVRILTDNVFPRSQVTQSLSRQGVWYGPFRTRATAERFESEVLDLFQMRRCQEDLQPAPDHPGCIYGEMGKCLRPCQEVVGVDEYRHESDRVVQFLVTGGRSLADSVEHARDRASADLDFESAARQHKRFEKIQEVLKMRDDLAYELDRLSGVAVTSSAEDGAVDLRFVSKGFWQPVERFAVLPPGGKMVSMDQRLREWVAAMTPVHGSVRDRQDHLALLARWYYSSWREGDWISFEDGVEPPYRKLVRAISRAAQQKT
jgi:excinuclease UvrABC nuclease subunit